HRPTFGFGVHAIQTGIVHRFRGDKFSLAGWPERKRLLLSSRSGHGRRYGGVGGWRKGPIARLEFDGHRIAGLNFCRQRERNGNRRIGGEPPQRLTPEELVAPIG